MKSWLTKFSGAVAVSALAAGTGLAAGILVLRLLPPAEAGRYTLVTSIAGFIGVIALFGQPNLINRLYARSTIPYHWPRDLATSLGISALVILAGGAIALIFYRLSAFEIVFIGGFALLTAVIYTGASMLNSYRHYVWSALLLRLTNALLIVPLVLISFGVLALAVNTLLGAQLLIALGCGALALLGLRLYLPAASGMQPISASERREAFGLAILVFTHLLLDPGLIVVAGYWLTPAALAGFGAYFNLLGPYLLLWSILVQTIGVEFSRNPAFPKRRILAAVWAALLPVIAISWALLPMLASVLYKGKYDSFSGIALPIGSMGGLLLTEAVPRGFVSVVSSTATLRRYIRDQAIATLLMAGVEVFMVGRLGIYGVAWAGVLMLLGRNAIAYAYFRRASGEASARREGAER